MLEVQKFISSNSLALLGSLGIKVKEFPALGVIVLNYDQITSDPNHPIVQECRALILEVGSWKVMSLPFTRFFNLGEQKAGMEQFDWSEFEVQEKLDGSLISFWYHPLWGWQTATRSVADGENTYDAGGETFKCLILKTLAEMGTGFTEVTSFLDPHYCYAFELLTPENQVVVRHSERKLSLLGIRHLPTLQEVQPTDWLRDHPDFPLPLTPRHEGFDPRATPEVVEGRNPLEFEGYVLVDRNFNRIKVKSSAYCLMSSRKDSLAKSNKARIELILTGKDDDVLAMLPKWVQEKILDLKTRINSYAQRIDSDYLTVKAIEVQKDFAAAVIPMDKAGGCAAAMFSIRKGFTEDGMSFIRTSLPKNILQMIRIQDEEAEVPEC